MLEARARKIGLTLSIAFLLSGCGTARLISGEHEVAERPVIENINYDRGQKGSQIAFAAFVTTGTGLGDRDLSYFWDFGEIATPRYSDEATPTVTIAGDPGDYDQGIKLTVFAGSGAEQSETSTKSFQFKVLNVQAEELAILAVMVPTGASGDSAKFTAEVAKGDPSMELEHHWEFGEGTAEGSLDTSTSAANVILAKGKEQPYLGKLTVTAILDGHTVSIAERSFEYSVASLKVKQVTPGTTIAGEVITLSAILESGTPLTYAWDLSPWGDPAASAGATTDIQLPSEPGEYAGRLTVANEFEVSIFPFTLTVTN